MIEDLLLLTAAVTFIVDLSGARQTLLDAASRLLGRKVVDLRPLTCSLCCSFWCGILYAALNGYSFLQVVAIGAACGLAAKPVGELLAVAQDIPSALVRLIDKLINKI